MGASEEKIEILQMASLLGQLGHMGHVSGQSHLTTGLVKSAQAAIRQMAIELAAKKKKSGGIKGAITGGIKGFATGGPIGAVVGAAGGGFGKSGGGGIADQGMGLLGALKGGGGGSIGSAGLTAGGLRGTTEQNLGMFGQLLAGKSGTRTDVGSGFMPTTNLGQTTQPQQQGLLSRLLNSRDYLEAMYENPQNMPMMGLY